MEIWLIAGSQRLCLVQAQEGIVVPVAAVRSYVVIFTVTAKHFMPQEANHLKCFETNIVLFFV